MMASALLFLHRTISQVLLKKCFEMGILKIITTDDYKILQDELVYCIKKGMSYRDAAKYKDSVPEKISVKHTRKTVMKRMIGIAGTCENIGVTHNAIVLANFFRQKGYMVALVEKNNSGAFETLLYVKWYRLLYGRQ